MAEKISNPCVRCGTERIVLKTWKEHVNTFFGNSTVVHTETVCPNKECQKLVNKEIAYQQEKRDKIKKDKEERGIQNKTGREKRKSISL